MADDDFDRDHVADQLAERRGSSQPPIPLSESQLAAKDEVSMSLSQAAAIIVMLLYHLDGSDGAVSYGDDLLRSTLPLERLLNSAADSAPAVHGPPVVERLEQVAAMSRLLGITVREEALGRPLANFEWLSNFVWTLETQIEQVQSEIARELQSRTR